MKKWGKNAEKYPEKGRKAPGRTEGIPSFTSTSLVK
jgi:hypothetical protein